MEKREILKETELFVLDMDGTFYLDTDVLDGALDFLEAAAGFFTSSSRAVWALRTIWHPVRVPSWWR